MPIEKVFYCIADIFSRKSKKFHQVNRHPLKNVQDRKEKELPNFIFLLTFI